jgi:amino acid transporter
MGRLDDGEAGQPGLVPVLNGFGNFAIAMSTICILAGGITSFHVGLCSVGGAAVGLGWPLGCLCSLIVALTMAEIASAFPRAGGPYQWAAELGGSGWGWVAGCFNLAGLVTALAAVNVGFCRFVVDSMRRALDFEPQTLPLLVAGAASVVTLSQALINHYGMRLTSRLTNLSGFLIVIVAALLTGSLLILPWLQGRVPDPSRLIAFQDYSGAAGGDVFPSTGNIAWLFCLGLLLPAYTITGFDVSAQTAEETFAPEWHVPRGIVRAVLISGAAGWIMLAAVVLAAPSLDAAAAAGDQSFLWILREVVPQRPLRLLLYVGIDIAQYICGLATLTAASRLTWALARDRGLPCSRWLRRIGSHRVPSVAIWTVGIVAVLFALFVPYTAIAAVCATFLYIAYVLPTTWGLLKYGRWPSRGPWHLGRWYRPLAVACVLVCALLIAISMQPPNEIAVWVVGVMVAGLLGLWFGWMRHRFRLAEKE